MFNNHITYDQKWETEENRKAFKKLQSKYFHRSECCPDCPISWAKEVLELFENLDSEIGIKFNETSMSGYYIKGNAFLWFFRNPAVGVYNAIKNTFIKTKYEKKNFIQRLLSLPKRVAESIYLPVQYGIDAITIKYLNKYRNKLLKKRIEISQIKEKYGNLTIYFNCPEAFRDYVEREIRKCEIKLSLKGAYSTLQNLYDSQVSYFVNTENYPDTINLTPRDDGCFYLKKTVYRNLMKEMGIDMTPFVHNKKDKQNGLGYVPQR